MYYTHLVTAYKYEQSLGELLIGSRFPNLESAMEAMDRIKSEKTSCHSPKIYKLSVDHVGCNGDYSYEYYVKEGDLYRADLLNIIREDGYRKGQRICSVEIAIELRQYANLNL